MRYAILCNENGETQGGSDGYIPLVGQHGFHRDMQAVRDYRDRFQKNFNHKYSFWTHVMFSNDICGKGKPYAI